MYHSRTVKQDSRKSWQHQHTGSISAQLQQRIQVIYSWQQLYSGILASRAGHTRSMFSSAAAAVRVLVALYENTGVQYEQKTYGDEQTYCVEGKRGWRTNSGYTFMTRNKQRQKSNTKTSRQSRWSTSTDAPSSCGRGDAQR